MVAQGVAGGLRKVATLPDGRSEPGQGAVRPGESEALPDRSPGWPSARAGGPRPGVDDRRRRPRGRPV